MVDLWHDVDKGKDFPNTFTAIVETPKGSRNKYEVNKDTGTVMLDRVLYSPNHYPADYGFVPQTYWDDNDPLDVLIVVHDSTFPGCIINARPVGMLHMIDGDEDDHKIVAVPSDDPRFKHVESVEDLGVHFKEEVSHFFAHYKDLQGKKVEIKDWHGKKEAIKALNKSVKLYEEKFNK